MNNKALRTLFLYNGIFVGAAAMLGPLYAIYVVKFVDGVTAVSISWAAFLVSTSIFTYIVSRKGDGIKEKEYLLLAGYIVRILSWILLIFVHNLTSLVLVQILLGFGESLGTPSFNALFADHLDKNKHIKEYSNWSLIANLTSAAGILAGGAIVNNFGFKALFLFMSALSLVTFFGILLKPRKLL
ncbi:MAG: Multi-drug resistance efflux pump [Candidatus Moranbacteria bacterium GW2011_GWE1_35_17]|nr:MAG: Multi-drug resistance efflux pump [Candidatus Moranbacteria bacterium GW2011_GWE1_35_17]KKP80707.1 MAG: Multi-drug resistance efflux pump [Candidatus Moranbacteria bacterium GW2011_GWF1_35_5]KKP84788.1 MAG: Multi-drug resistance efflux pump [Candidatus Moranbacteria bacterium GW2011_GWF2_35_54]